MSVAKTTDRYYRLASYVLFVAVAFVAVMTFADYGMSWDEYFRWKGGQEKLVYYQALFAGEDATQYLPKADLYPGLFDLTLAVMANFTGLGLLQAGHLLSLFCGFLAMAGAWAIGRLLGGERLAFWCTLFLLLMPRFYGHMFFNPKDIPFAAAMTWSLYFLLKWGTQLPKPKISASVILGVAVGLTLAVRIGGMVVFGYIFGYAVCAIIRQLVHEKGLKPGFWRQAFRLLIHGFAIAVIAFLVLIPWWPAIHANLLFAPFEALGKVSQYPWEGHVLFAGNYYSAPDLPWYYPLVWLYMALPDLVLVVLVAGFALLLARLRTAAMHAFTQKGFPWLVVTTCTVFPVLYVIVRDSTLYDGIRHLLFILPPLACLAGFAWVRLLDLLASRSPRLPLAACGVLGLLIIFQLVTLVRLHPYQYVYFNQLNGGLPAARDRFETEYWGTSLREAHLWLDAYAPERDEPYYVKANLPAWLATMHLPERFKLTADRDKADFYLSLTRLQLDTVVDGEVVHVVERYGVPFAVIKDLRTVQPDS